MSIIKYIKRGIRYVVSGVPVYKTVANVQVAAPSELLKGRTAIVTGGTSGIGYSIAKAFINAGAYVVITGRSQEKINKACEKINSEVNNKNNIIGIELDNTNVGEFDAKLEMLHKTLGNRKIDILVNNAGILGGHISNITEDVYDNVLDTNLKAVFFLSKKIGLYFKENNIQGNILNIASSSSLRPAISAYTISKWGIRGLTLGLAKALAPYGITVNGLAPGQTATPMLRKDNDSENLYLGNVPIKRFALPEEIANMAVILVSNMGRTIMGDIVYMTGGAGVFSNDDMNYKF